METNGITSSTESDVDEQQEFSMLSESLLVTPHCTGMEELPAAAEERARLQADSSLA